MRWKKVASTLFAMPLLLTPSLANAAPTTASAATAQHDCKQLGINCWWAGKNFTGKRAHWSDPVWSGCLEEQPGRSEQSYAFYGGQEGYFFQSPNCTGPSKAVLSNTEGNIGFVARSFLYGCVSCLLREKGLDDPAALDAPPPEAR